MSDTTRDPRRFGTRTWRPEVVAAPVPQVQDEAVRAVLLIRRRALDNPAARPSDDEEWRVLDKIETLIARAGGRMGYTRRPRQRERRCR